VVGYLVVQYLYLIQALVHSGARANPVIDDVIGSLRGVGQNMKMGTELVLEMLEHFNILIRLLARENFLEFSRRENINTYYTGLTLPQLPLTRLSTLPLNTCAVATKTNFTLTTVKNTELFRLFEGVITYHVLLSCIMSYRRDYILTFLYIYFYTSLLTSGY
jgi:hypothetical protein